MGRLSYIDNIRSFLTWLVVIHHILMVYAGIPGFSYLEKPTDKTSFFIFGSVLFFNQSFFMTFFFLLAGYFTPRSYERRGAKIYIWDRFVRLFIPYLFVMFVLWPFSCLWGFHLPFNKYPIVVSPGPMWFASLLFLFQLGYALWPFSKKEEAQDEEVPSEPLLGGDGPLESEEFPIKSINPRFLMWKAFAFIAVPFGIANFIVRIWIPDGYFIPFFITFEPSYILVYLGAFILGSIGFSKKGYERWIQPLGILHPSIMCGVSVICLFFSISADFFLKQGEYGGGWGWLSFMFAMAQQGITVSIIPLFLNAMTRKWGTVQEFLVKNAYGVYALHPLIVTAWGVIIHQANIPSWVKGVLGCLIVPPAVWGFARLVRYIPGVKRMLG